MSIFLTAVASAWGSDVLVYAELGTHVRDPIRTQYEVIGVLGIFAVNLDVCEVLAGCSMFRVF